MYVGFQLSSELQLGQDCVNGVLRFLCNTRIGHTYMVTSIFKGPVVSS